MMPSPVLMELFVAKFRALDLHDSQAQQLLSCHDEMMGRFDVRRTSRVRKNDIDAKARY